MRKPSERMPIRSFILQKALAKHQETGKRRLILVCQAYGYDLKEIKAEIRELRKTGQIYCCRREEFFKIT